MPIKKINLSCLIRGNHKTSIGENKNLKNCGRQEAFILIYQTLLSVRFGMSQATFFANLKHESKKTFSCLQKGHEIYIELNFLFLGPRAINS